MADGDELVSKPKAKEELYVLCIDGTEASDSAAFFAYVQRAGLQAKRSEDRVAVRNLLDLIGEENKGEIADPLGKKQPDGSPAPPLFSANDMKTLPIEPIAVPGSKSHKVRILLPQGKVTGSQTTYADPALGSDTTQHETIAKKNSRLLETLILAPGVSKTEGSSWHLDFAKMGGQSTDVLYLSGHGSMAGTICGESGPPDHHIFGYMDYFKLTNVIQDDYLRIGTSGVVPPRWIVIASCYSMREIHAEIWLRLFKQQKRLAVRGILGYQTTAPLSQAAVKINWKFAEALGKGATFIHAWKHAHDDGGKGALREKWTAAAFDYSESDTLLTLRDLKTGKAPASVGKGDLYHHSQKARIGPIAIRPPSVFLELHHWDFSPPAEWTKALITNLDRTEATAEFAKKDDPLYVSNGSWQACKGKTGLAGMSWWEHKFCPSNIYAVQVFPPFREEFENGFRDAKQTEPEKLDELELSLVHVRHTYPKCFAFESVFDVLGVNREVAGKGQNFWIPGVEADPKLGKDAQQAKVLSRIRMRCPSSRTGFQPARLVLRYKLKNKDIGYLWFWLRVRILRDGAAIFDEDLDSFIISPETHDIEIMKPDAPFPPELTVKGAPT